MPQRNLERPCPICSKPTTYFAEPVGPFCSPRCQMIDLGKWLNEDYRISEPLKPAHFEGFGDEENDEGAPEPYRRESHEEL